MANSRKKLKWLFTVTCFILLMPILFGVVACGGGLDEDDKQVYKMVGLIFDRLDCPEKSNLISGTIDDFGDGYFCIEEDGTYKAYYVDKSTKKVYDSYEIIMFYDTYSYEYDQYCRLPYYEDPYCDYEAINKKLDNKYNQ